MWVLSLINAVVLFFLFTIWTTKDYMNAVIKVALVVLSLINAITCFTQYGYIIKIGG